MERPPKTAYMRYLREREDLTREQQAERYAKHLLLPKHATAKGIWKDRPMHVKRRGIPTTGNIDPGTMSATRTDVRRYQLRSVSVREAVRRAKER